MPITPEVALHSVYSQVNGLRIHARIAEVAPAGSARLPIVLVHGLAVSSRYLAPTGRQIGLKRWVYAPDLPGFGASDRPNRVLDIPALAAALLDWMDARGLETAVMLGNSLGCQIIVDVGFRSPQRLAAAILVGPTPDPAARSVLAHAWRLARDVPRESLSSILTQGSDYLRAGFRRTLATMRYALADPFEHKLPLVAAPTLVVRGEHDPIAPQRWCAQVADRLPHGELLMIPAAPHALNHVRPVPLARATLDFLARNGI
ncbi:MAG: alpha/beta hydrolase [Oscillochloris sp.]|nr:alpha/beta hydrolase [Oscillochloris sp.]